MQYIAIILLIISGCCLFAATVGGLAILFSHKVDKPPYKPLPEPRRKEPEKGADE